jgi:type I restriction enzyme R subunit
VADYLLSADGQVVGVIEAKREGTPLAGVELQTAKYSDGLPDGVPARVRPIPFLRSQLVSGPARWLPVASAEW